MAESLRGRLLIAGATMLDPNFARTVILVAEHSEDEGAMGIVLNRPSEAPVGDAIPGLADLVDGDAFVYVGGPVQSSAVTALAEFDDPDEAATIVFGDVGFIKGDEDIALIAGSIRRARIYAGYAGWTTGQLEAELEQEDWFVHELPLADDVFSDEPEELWSVVLQRKGGRYALVARMPLDPSVN
jgi:putative transcriptional regulator